ncbi:hypothetical protein JNA71_20450 [Bacillus halotolerans]|nr:hypothetical protein [Bacillus halotolerans]
MSKSDYFEKLGDKYEEMGGMPGNGENDRLGLSKKTIDYEETVKKLKLIEKQTI